MKSIISVFGIVLLFTCNISYSQDTIHWSPSYKLKWEDFRAIPDTVALAFAISSSGIDYTYTYTDSSFTFRVIAYFDKKDSWKKPMADSNLLKHEQGHFDITEIFALKLKNELAEFIPKRASGKAAINNIVKKTMNEKESMQNLYDEETSFGRDIAAQRKWLEKIAKEIRDNLK